MARFLHTRIRVGDLDRSIAFYCRQLGFGLASRTDKSPAGNHVAHLALEGNAHTLELTWSPEYKLQVPADLMHLAIAVPDLVAFCAELERNGIAIWPGGWREVFAGGRKMAFIDDPDGYEIELLEG
jgi:lactoylglutathione lyase